MIVAIAIPVTLALTLLVFYLYGYTLNRITLFALIFSIGILVDDAIVVVENIVRHYRLPENRGRPLTEVAVEAVDEVGNPTDPGHLGGHRRDPAHGLRRRPDGALHAADPGRAPPRPCSSRSLVAFIVTPWAAVRLLEAGEPMRARSSGEGVWMHAPLPPGHGRPLHADALVR